VSGDGLGAASAAEQEWVAAQIVVRSARDRRATLELEHRDGVPWWSAPLPRRWHRCRWQTRGWVGLSAGMERCACGAARYPGRAWLFRNARRRPDGAGHDGQAPSAHPR